MNKQRCWGAQGLHAVHDQQELVRTTPQIQTHVCAAYARQPAPSDMSPQVVSGSFVGSSSESLRSAPS